MCDAAVFGGKFVPVSTIKKLAYGVNTIFDFAKIIKKSK
jgi:hypothetical protein